MANDGEIVRNYCNVLRCYHFCPCYLHEKSKLQLMNLFPLPPAVADIILQYTRDPILECLAQKVRIGKTLCEIRVPVGPSSHIRFTHMHGSEFTVCKSGFDLLRYDWCIASQQHDNSKIPPLCTWYLSSYELIELIYTQTLHTLFLNEWAQKILAKFQLTFLRLKE